MDDTRKFAELINLSKKIVFFGGAGVSTESGLKDYRSADGIYFTAQNFGRPPEEILSRDCFFQDPELFYKFYRAFFLQTAEPNFTHEFLVRLEKSGKDVTVVTQNIDGLHQAAGSRKVFELHGTTSSYTCIKCGKKYGPKRIKSSPENIPKCDCGGILKPDVVLYGEQLDEKTVNGAVKAISEADLLIVGGTSLAVYPAAGFVRFFSGNAKVLINRDPTPFDKSADLVFHASLGDVFSTVSRLIFAV